MIQSNLMLDKNLRLSGKRQATMLQDKTSLLFLCFLATQLSGLYIHKEELFSAQNNPNEKNTDIVDNIIENNREKDNNLFEGDINLADSFQPGTYFSTDGNIDTKEVEDAIYKRNAMRNKAFLWPSRRVPYVISPELYEHEDLIKSVFHEYHLKTCIRFVRHTSERKYLRFYKGNGCFSAVGRAYWQPGKQDISLGEGCYFKGTIIHEVMHAIGFWHEQSRPDRNKYIEVMWENIEPGMEPNFNKYGHDKTESLVEYDYGSIMHYGKYSFSTNGKETIKPIDSTKEIGQRRGFSDQDIQEINILYDCKDPRTYGWSSWSTWSLCDKSCVKQKQRFCMDMNRANCPGANQYDIGVEKSKCSYAECYAPVDGHWGRWGAWSDCSATCDTGTRTRSRQCDDPVPQNNGKQCTGSSADVIGCQMKSCSAGPYDCEFEIDMCNWKNDETAKVDWERISGATSTKKTGPEKDHTSGSGFYVYFEASSPTKNKDKARLRSPGMKGKGKRCLTFWYHMYGSGIGNLKVLCESRGRKAVTLFEKHGDQGNEWKLGEITYDGSQQHHIVIEAQRVTSFRSDMGIDDISLKEHACGVSPPAEKTTDKKKCSSPLGMESGKITDSQITASSSYDSNHGPQYGRLNSKRVWCISHRYKDRKNQYIQIKFEAPTVVTAVATQGHPTWDNWVTKYQIKYSKDGLMFKKYHENDQILNFQGNKDRNTPMKMILNKKITVVYLRIVPQAYYGNDACMRVEIYGCPAA